MATRGRLAGREDRGLRKHHATWHPVPARSAASAGVVAAERLYALPAWGILVIRTGEKTVIAPSVRELAAPAEFRDAVQAARKSQKHAGVTVLNTHS
jgi:hypothetical protein